MKLKIVFGMLLLMLAAIPHSFAQQNELAATLEVLTEGVEVKRVNTVNWIPVKVEAIVGIGDVIRTDDVGQARITFFADGVDTDILPNSEFVIDAFSGDDTSFNLEVTVLLGQTVQRLGRVLDANSSYDVNTPGMTLAARGTEFAIRVEDGGRSGMLVREGVVDAQADDSSADVPPEFGIRSEADAELSDVVHASTFDELDAALDGCIVSVSTPDDVRINVRIGPATDAFRVGTIAAEDIDTFLGVSESGGWYRILFNGGFGWILSSGADIDDACAGLRVFDASHMEDVESYELLGEVIDPSDYSPLETPTTTEEDTSTDGE